MNGEKFARMIREAAAMLKEEKQAIDSLNVFPVPDGDTGTNMYLTMAAAANEVDRRVPASLGEVADAAARGSLLGARGNSGVILSQLLRGIAGGLKNTEKVSPPVFADALAKGTEVAYRAVMKPVEGTILTVAREASEAAQKAAREKKTIEEVLKLTLAGAGTALSKTPELLPVLAQYGVVDAGGRGWETVLKGFLAGATGERAETGAQVLEKHEPFLVQTGDTVLSTGLEFKYCTELIIKGREIPVDSIKTRLALLGDSLLAVGTDETVKVHLHSNQPGQVLEICLEYGELDDIKIDNMSMQQRPNVPETVEKPMGIVVVAAGKGLEEIFLSLGADVVVSGGQTMNPSAEEIAQAVERIRAETVIILPNNGNIILTAGLARDLVQKKVEVLPSRSIQQGIAALVAFAPDKKADENTRLMRESMGHVISGEVTYAVRDSEYEGRPIKTGDILGLAEEKIIVVGQDVNCVTQELIASVMDDSMEILTIYYGEKTSPEQAGALMKAIEDKWPQVEKEIHFGGQPLYYYLFSVE